MVEMDLQDAFGALRHPDVWSSFVGCVGTRVVAVMMRCATGHSLMPFPKGVGVPLGHGCRQRGTGQPQLLQCGPWWCNAGGDRAVGSDCLQHARFCPGRGPPCRTADASPLITHMT